MGASGWDYFVPYQPDIQRALQELREDVFRRGAYYDPVAFLQSFVNNTELMQRMSSQERKQTRDQVAQMSLRPKPLTIPQLIEANGTSGTHSIIDIERIADTPDFGAAAPFSQQELETLFGTDRPTHAMIVQKSYMLQSARSRWCGTYIIVYKDGEPDEIYFTGFSGD
jgi:hypothetical protein